MIPPNVQAAKYVPEKSSIFFSGEGSPVLEAIAAGRVLVCRYLFGDCEQGES